MNILLKVWSDGADYALVTIEPAYALRLLEKVKVAQDIKARYGHLHQLTFFECGPVLFDGELIGLETEERLVLDKPLFIPLDRQARLDCVMLKVTHEEVRWEGHIKHTDVRWETAVIPLSILKKMASVKIGGGCKMTSVNRLLTADDIAQRLQVSQSLAYNLMQRGEIPTVRLGRAVRVRPQDFEEFIKSRVCGSNGKLVK
jgi:excisionase family DNA binding protein